MLTLVLSNASSPIYPNLLPFRPVRIEANDGSTTRTHWVGWIEPIKPGVNRNGKRVVEITATGPIRFIEAAETNSILQENVRTDHMIASLIRELVIPPALQRDGAVGNNMVFRAVARIAVSLESGNCGTCRGGYDHLFDVLNTPLSDFLNCCPMGMIRDSSFLSS